jgi:excisionase family DNA binding protein
MPKVPPAKRPTYMPTGRPRGRLKGSKTLNHPAAEQTPLEPMALRYEAAAHYIGVSRSMMKKLVAKGTVRSVAIGNTRLILVDSLRQLLSPK